MGKKRRNRSVGKIDRLSPELKYTVEQMLLNGSTYKEIVGYLGENGVELSQMSVCRYAEKYLATVEMLQMAQANFRMINEEIDKYPDLDMTEAILRISSQHILNAMMSRENDDFEDADPDKLLKNAAALIRATAYKKRIDMQNKTELETAIDANKSLLFDALKKHPDLYKQVMDALKQEQASLEGVAP